MTDVEPRTAVFVLPGLGLGGAERHVVLSAQHLDPARWRPRVVTFERGPLADDLHGSGIPVDVLPAPDGARGVQRTASALEDYLTEHRPDVLSAQHFVADLPVRLALRKLRSRGAAPVPYVVWKHTYGHVGYRGARERAFEAALGSLVTGYAAVCFTQVTYLRDQLGIDPSRVRVIQNSLPAGVELPAPASPLPRLGDGPVVAMVGAFRADKGHEDLLEAWADVVREVPDASLALVGDGPERARLEAGSSALPNLHFLGARTDAPSLVAGADVFTLASYNVECFPYAVLEAMAAGVPVVSTVTGGLAEMIDHGRTGLLVPPRSPRDLARALTEVLAAPERGAELGAAGRRRLAEVFPFERWVAELNNSYDAWVARAA